MDKRVATLIVYALLLNESKRSAIKRLKVMKQQRDRRRRAFVQRQAMERFMFVVLMTVAHCNGTSPERMIWTKERSSYWWEYVVNSTFTSQDWLENFHMSRQMFLYLCDELKSSIEKSDTVMRKAVPADMRVALSVCVPCNWC